VAGLTKGLTLALVPPWERSYDDDAQATGVGHNAPGAKALARQRLLAAHPSSAQNLYVYSRPSPLVVILQNDGGAIYN
jgi:hypothetical protein